MKATLNKGIVPVSDDPLAWTIKSYPNPVCG
jgi:leukotriene-A4 hydrolase